MSEGKLIGLFVLCAPASRYRLLESRLEETVQQTLKVREEKISRLERKLEESNTLNTTLRAKLTTVSMCAQTSFKEVSSLYFKMCNNVFCFFQGEENHNYQQCSGGDRSQGSATAELLRIKDHLIDVEKNVRFVCFF